MAKRGVRDRQDIVPSARTLVLDTDGRALPYYAYEAECRTSDGRRDAEERHDNNKAVHSLLHSRLFRLESHFRRLVWVAVCAHSWPSSSGRRLRQVTSGPPPPPVPEPCRGSQ